MISAFLKWTINTWIAVTGRTRAYSDYPWLRGPISDEQVIGDAYYDLFAAQNGLVVKRSADGGLLRDFKIAIAGEDPLKNKLNISVARFYEHTVQYKLEVWSQWYAPFSIFAKLLIRSLSSKMDQLNIPLQPLETSRGMSNEVLHLEDPATGELKYACWLRKTILSGRVVYAGFYSCCIINGIPYVKVVFPLPKGNVTVILKVVVQADGSVKLISGGKHKDNSGYYRILKRDEKSVKARYVPLKECIHVFEDEEGILRTDHSFSVLGRKLLDLHYKILPRKQ